MTSYAVIVVALLATQPAPRNAPPDREQSRFQLDANQMKLLKTFRDEFILITPGKDGFPRSFQMGSTRLTDAEQPVHEVTFNYSFEVARYEVPQNLWEAVMGKNPSRWKGPRNSVEMLNFEEAQQFCARATRMMRQANLIRENQVVRLPSEAEWEYVARAGTETLYSFGNDEELLDAYGWHTGNAAGNDPPVGAKKPNPWGLYDVHGYLWEWCLDTAHDNYEQAPRDGTAWIDDANARRAETDTADESRERRVIRGGSWKDPARNLASACRHGMLRHLTVDNEKVVVRFSGGIDAEIRDDAIGLRCVLVEAARDE